MRTSKKQQDQTRRQLLAAAVELMSAQGYESCSMKQIAKAAGVGDATIYKYFPHKEALLRGYFEQAIDEALQQWRQTDQLDRFSLQEQLQWMLDCLLARLLPDREFVALARAQAQRAPLLVLSEGLPGKSVLQAECLALLKAAQVRGEIPASALSESLAGMAGDFAYGVIGFWLCDESVEFGETTQLLDLSLELLVLVLQTGLIDKLLGLAGFVLRSQLGRLMRGGSGVLDALRVARASLQSMKATEGGRA